MVYSYDEIQKQNSRVFEYLEMICKGQERAWEQRGFDAHFHDLSDKELMDILKDINCTWHIVNSIVSHIIGYDIPSSEGV
jgi:hypothetical protein